MARNNPLTPHLTCDDAAAAIDFYVKAFGATEEFRLTNDDGQIVNACVLINGAPVMLVDELPHAPLKAPKTLGGTSVCINLNVDDVDASTQRAIDAGAEVVLPVDDQFWGDRYGVVRDPFGHEWAIATPGNTETDPAKLKAKMDEAMAAQA